MINVTTNSTYMAAAGLRPQCLSTRNSSVSQTATSIQQVIVSTNVAKAVAVAATPATATATGSASLSSTMLFASNGNLLKCISPSGDPIVVSPDPTSVAEDDHKRLIASQRRQNLVCMVRFASALMDALNSINKQSFQAFKLRVGLHTGSVIAGVVGAQRPFYDIWGDCVNVSRFNPRKCSKVILILIVPMCCIQYRLRSLAGWRLLVRLDAYRWRKKRLNY